MRRCRHFVFHRRGFRKRQKEKDFSVASNRETAMFCAPALRFGSATEQEEQKKAAFISWKSNAHTVTVSFIFQISLWSHRCQKRSQFFPALVRSLSLSHIHTQLFGSLSIFASVVSVVQCRSRLLSLPPSNLHTFRRSTLSLSLCLSLSRFLPGSVPEQTCQKERPATSLTAITNKWSHF